MTKLKLDGEGREFCEKYDATIIDAYVDVALSDTDPTHLILDSSWGTTDLDLTPAIKAGETVTHMYLYPKPEDGDAEYLRFDPENGPADCIHGDDLSRIISMQKLKDVDQSTAPYDGGVYQYDEATGKFVLFNLKEFVTAVNNALTTINATLTQYGNRLTNLENRVTAIEAILTPPANAPSNIRLCWGNINSYSDCSNTSSRSWGLYTHDLSTTIPNDEYFA